MPELPELEIYARAIRTRLHSARLEQIQLLSPFVLRTVEPPVEEVVGGKVIDVHRLGKRLAIQLDNACSIVVHLMLGGEFLWFESNAKLPRRSGLAIFRFSLGTLGLVETGSKKRASIHLTQGEEDLAKLDPGGVEPLTADEASFADAVSRENHTLKRTLTDPRIISGIGNAFSDEILHRAKLSPFLLSQKASEKQIETLRNATRTVLEDWIGLLESAVGDRFPRKIRTHRKAMAVHGRYGEPCPECGTSIQRIRFAEREANYCARCQTGGRVLADRALSRLLKDDWPKTIEDAEQKGLA